LYQDSELPKTIAGGQYKLISRLGQGGMAVVYRAEVDLARFDFPMVVAGHEAATGTPDERYAYRAAKYELWKQKPREELIAICNQFKLPYPKERTAAVKVMIPQQREDALIRFESEWRQLLAINHPHLIKVYGGGRERDLPWYSMEVVENILPLQDSRTLPEMAKLDMVFQAAGGLQALHQRGIIHRDIKPANLIVSREGTTLRVRVMDLGIAKIAGNEGLTLSHHVMGTPYYMSPEQAASSKQVDTRADIYSLGATLYSLVCGTRPYEGKSMFEVVGSLVRGESPERPIHVKPGLNKYIGQLIEKMMELDPDNRLQTMEEVRSGIQAVFNNDVERCEQLLAPASRAKSGRKPPSSVSPAKGTPARTTPPARQGAGRRYQGHQRRELRLAPLMVGGGAIIVLLLAIIVGILTRPAETIDPLHPGSGSGSTDKPIKPVGSGSGSSPRESGSGSGSPASPVSGPRAAALEQMKADFAAILGLVREGRVREGDLQIEKLADQAPKHSLESELAKLKVEYDAERARYLDDLAKRALAAARGSDRTLARELVGQLEDIDAGNPKIAEIKEALEQAPKDPPRDPPRDPPTDPPRDPPTPPPGGVHTKPTADMFKSFDGKVRMAIELNSQLSEQEIDYRQLDFTAQGTGYQARYTVKPRVIDACLSFIIVNPSRLHMALELDMQTPNGELHVHTVILDPANPAAELIDLHHSASSAHGRQFVKHKIAEDVFKPGKHQFVIQFKTTSQYTLGPLRVRPLFNREGAVDQARIDALRQERKYREALELVERSKEVPSNVLLQKLRWRLFLLSRFEHGVDTGFAIAGARPLELAKLTADQAIEKARLTFPEHEPFRDGCEAAFLWELRDKRALPLAEAALKAGMEIEDLVAEIKASGGR